MDLNPLDDKMTQIGQKATLGKLKELAQAATPGEWVWVVDDTQHGTTMAELRTANGKLVCDFGDDTQYYPTKGTDPDREDMYFIAAANPAAVLELIALVERQEAEMKIARADNAGHHRTIKMLLDRLDSLGDGAPANDAATPQAQPAKAEALEVARHALSRVTMAGNVVAMRAIAHEAFLATSDTSLAKAEARISHAGKMPPSDEEMALASLGIAPWLASALDDPEVCDEYKMAISKWFDSAMPGAAIDQYHSRILATNHELESHIENTVLATPAPAMGEELPPHRELMLLLGMDANTDLHDIMAMAALRIKRLTAEHRACMALRQPADGEVVMLREVIRVVRSYPDFDDETSAFSVMMDEALSGKLPTLLSTIGALAQGRKPTVTAPVSQSAPAQPVAAQGEPIMFGERPVESMEIDLLCMCLKEHTMFDGPGLEKAWNDLVQFYMTNRRTVQPPAPVAVPAVSSAEAYNDALETAAEIADGWDTGNPDGCAIAEEIRSRKSVSQPAPVADIVREALEATFEQRPGYLTKVAAAVRFMAAAPVAVPDLKSLQRWSIAGTSELETADFGEILMFEDVENLLAAAPSAPVGGSQS